MPSIRKVIFEAYAVQQLSKPVEAKFTVAVKNPNDGYFDSKLVGIYRQRCKEGEKKTEAKIQASLNTYKPCGEYREIKSVKLDTDMQIVRSLEAGKVMSAVSRLPGYQKSWVEWAYTHLGGTVADFKKMIMASVSLKHLNNMMQNARATYQQTEDPVVKVMIDALEKHILALSSKGGTGIVVGREFFYWLDNKLKSYLEGKQDRVKVMVRKLALVAAFNHSRMAMCGGGSAPIGSEEMYRLVGVKRDQYCKNYKQHYEYVVSLCSELDKSSLPVVAGKIFGKKHKETVC